VKQPDLIGIQEGALWRRDGGFPDGSATPATEVTYDFVASLRSELARVGLPYRIVSLQQEADIEIPLDFTHDATPNPSYDGRLTIRDLILARTGLKTSNAKHANYTNEVVIPAGAAAGTHVKRGWESIDVTKRNHKFRFVNTHLESIGGPAVAIRGIQATELMGAFGPFNTAKPVILVGDLNSDPADPSPDSDAYNVFVTTNGLADRGVTVDTCCNDANLLNAGLQYTQRIDHVLTQGSVTGVSAQRLGANPAVRTPFGLWESDHAGVAAVLKVH
jgi:hypothetical protein